MVTKQHSGIYLNIHPDKIQGTLMLLRHFKKFLSSDCQTMNDPFSGFGFFLDKKSAKERLRWLINVAVNRKAGIPDVPGRKHAFEYQAMIRRDSRRVHEKLSQRVIVRYFETKEIRKRYSHLLETDEG